MAVGKLDKTGFISTWSHEPQDQKVFNNNFVSIGRDAEGRRLVLTVLTERRRYFYSLQNGKNKEGKIESSLIVHFA